MACEYAKFLNALPLLIHLNGTLTKQCDITGCSNVIEESFKVGSIATPEVVINFDTCGWCEILLK